jgi:hypothetical protein
MLWNIDNSVSGWNSATCYKSCHTGLSASDGYARHRTNNASERIDMWHWKGVRTGPNNQMDDQFQYDVYPNGRTNDDKISGGDVTNSQNLIITNSSPAITVAVPKYVIPGRTNYNWILTAETTNGTAKIITAVDANGVFTLNDGTTIDPNTDVAYQRSGAGVGSKVIPLIYTSPFAGSRGDITAKAIYTGTGWIVEYSRALKTADTKKQDVDFSGLKDQYFGFAIFENATIAHAIKPNLILKFKK